MSAWGTTWVGAGLLADVKFDTGPWRWTSLPAPWVLAVVVLALLLGARWIYGRERGTAGRGPRLALAGVRALVLLLLVLALAGPYREELRTSEEKSHLVVLLDSSTSMRNEDLYPPEQEQRLLAAAFPDDDASPRPDRLAGTTAATRLGLSRRVLAARNGALLRRLAERFVLHVFAFDEDWRSLGSTARVGPEKPRGAGTEDAADPIAEILRALGAQEAAGPRTRIALAMRNVATQFLGRPDQLLAGVVLISDGQETGEGETPLEVVTALPGADQLKVYAVGLGNPDSDKNLRVDPIRAKDVVLVRDEVMFETDLRHKGLTGVGVSARLEIEQVADAEGRAIPPRPVEAPGGDRSRTSADGLLLPAEDVPLAVRLRAPFDEPGTYRVTIRARLPATLEREDAILDDNAATHELRVVDTSIRVLYVDRDARWELRFLGNYLTREAPTSTGATGGGRRNRFLTHVLQQTADPTVTLPHTPGPDIFRKPLRSFPTKREDLFAYDVLIWGDVDLARLVEGGAEAKRQLLELIRDFVEQGGGIALQAGSEFHNPLDLLGTPMADLLPIAVTQADRNATSLVDSRNELRLRLTEAGRAHPAFNILPPPERGGERPDPARVARIWADEDPNVELSDRWAWNWAYRCLGGLRPGAVALATAFRQGAADARDLLDGRDQPIVLMASKGFGKGRVFWIGLDEMWRIRRGHGDTYYGAFWEQVIRDLATYRLLGGNKRFKIFPKEEEVAVGETAEILITALDERFQPLDAPFLDGVHVELPETAPGVPGGRIDLEGDARPERPSDAPPGEYVFRVPVTRPGTYLVWIEQRGEVRDAGERAERRFRGVARSREDALRLPDHQALAALARETGGQVVRLADLPAFDPPAQTVTRVLNRTRRDQWDKAWVLWLVVGLLGVEWALRKRWQMI